MPLDYNDPTIIGFLKENYEREMEKRTIWFMRNQDQIIDRSTLSDSYKDYRTENISRAYIEPLIPSLAIHHMVSMKNRRRKVPHDNPLTPISQTKNIKSLSDEQKVFLNKIMKPIDPSVSDILKLEFPYGGRQNYLQKRYELIPEEKYYFCETSSHIFGWCLGQSEIGFSVSDHKRKDLFTRDLVSRSGPHPDPPNYKEVENYSKCNS